MLAAATTADNVWLWDMTKPEADPARIDHTEFGTINDVALSPDGKLLAVKCRLPICAEGASSLRAALAVNGSDKR